jgi:dCMP deaminase
MTDWNKRFLDLAGHVAGWSKDPSTKVGAVIVNDDKQVLGLGYNGFPRGVHDCTERYNDRNLKLQFVAHAERNALDNAADVRGATLYSTLFPCTDCAKGIIQRGIRCVVTTQPNEVQSRRFNFETSKIMFDEAGVELLLL